MKWLWISCSWATFIIGYDSTGIVKETAPIAKWCVGKNINEVKQHYRKMGAIISPLEKINEQD